jgi:hypothetical protein
MITSQISDSKAKKSAAAQRQTDFISFGREVSTARWVRLGIAMIVLVAVAAIFIAPSIDLPAGVLREHSVLAHVSGSHLIMGIAVLIAANSLHAHYPLSGMRALVDRPLPNVGYDDQRPHVLRC